MLLGGGEFFLGFVPLPAGFTQFRRDFFFLTPKLTDFFFLRFEFPSGRFELLIGQSQLALHDVHLTARLKQSAAVKETEHGSAQRNEDTGNKKNFGNGNSRGGQ